MPRPRIGLHMLLDSFLDMVSCVQDLTLPDTLCNRYVQPDSGAHWRSPARQRKFCALDALGSYGAGESGEQLSSPTPLASVLPHGERQDRIEDSLPAPNVWLALIHLHSKCSRTIAVVVPSRPRRCSRGDAVSVTGRVYRLSKSCGK